MTYPHEPSDREMLFGWLEFEVDGRRVIASPREVFYMNCLEYAFHLTPEQADAARSRARILMDRENRRQRRV